MFGSCDASSVEAAIFSAQTRLQCAQPLVDLLLDERIRRHPRVVLTPHAAFYSAEGWVEMRTKGAEEGRRLLLGEAVRNPVNLHCLVSPRAVIPHTSPVEA